MEKFLIFLRLYAHNKVSVWTNGNEQYAATAKKCMQSATSAWCHFDKERFISDMRKQGVPDSLIIEYVENISMDDEVILRPDKIF